MRVRLIGQVVKLVKTATFRRNVHSVTKFETFKRVGFVFEIYLFDSELSAERNKSVHLEAGNENERGVRPSDPRLRYSGIPLLWTRTGGLGGPQRDIISCPSASDHAPRPDSSFISGFYTRTGSVRRPIIRLSWFLLESSLRVLIDGPTEGSQVAAAVISDCQKALALLCCPTIAYRLGCPRRTRQDKCGGPAWEDVKNASKYVQISTPAV